MQAWLNFHSKALTTETLSTVPLKQIPLGTNEVGPQFPHCKVWITILTSWAGYSTKCNVAHAYAWCRAWHAATRTPQVLDFIHYSVINTHLLWAELCPLQNALC